MKKIYRILILGLAFYAPAMLSAASATPLFLDKNTGLLHVTAMQLMTERSLLGNPINLEAATLFAQEKLTALNKVIEHDPDLELVKARMLDIMRQRQISFEDALTLAKNDLEKLNVAMFSEYEQLRKKQQLESSSSSSSRPAGLHQTRPTSTTYQENHDTVDAPTLGKINVLATFASLGIFPRALEKLNALMKVEHDREMAELAAPPVLVSPSSSSTSSSSPANA
ncbi:MAG TPA: hypothetical protein VLG71_01040, partial [Candidatus Limnocylindria bacterium]|nr:hypothetical protein [Candidatus Limnocylindria bacterium]